MLTNWYLTQALHEQHVKEMQRKAQMRHLARANRRPTNWLTNALRWSLATLRPRQRRQTNLPKRARGATA